MKKYRLNINNLDCASCARKVEESLNKNSKISNCTVNFSTSKISFESEQNISISEINKLVKAVEPDANVSDYNSKKMSFRINNLDCASCARKLEEHLSKKDYLKNVSVNFNTSKITFESSSELTLDELNKLIKEVEPDAYASIDEVKHKSEYHVSMLLLGTILGLIASYIKMPNYLSIILFVISYAILLYRPCINAFKLLIKSKTINENFLITVSCIGAFALGCVSMFTKDKMDGMMEGVMVVALYTLGKILESKAINNTRNSIKDLIDIKQNYANLKDGNKVKEIKVEDIKINDLLIVKKGEKIPVDGIITEGTTNLDTSALTGESELVEVQKGNEVLSGSINEGNIITIKATKIFSDSTVSKILELVEEATDKKASKETMVAKISKVYTPVVLLLAIIVMLVEPLFGVSIGDSIYRGLTFLVISCPCAIAISVPLSYFTGIGVASKNGILVKGSNYLDNLSKLTAIIFDKTGTLTSGTFEVKEISIMDDHYTKDEIIELLIKGESYSNHPIAKSIMKLSDKKYSNKDVTNYKEIPGEGISYKVKDKSIKVGTQKGCNCNIEALLHMNINGKHVASITIDDGIKNHVEETIRELKKQNIKTYMFTGDKKDVALSIGNKLGIDEIKYEMLPQEKYKEYEKVVKNELVTAFVGDGVNDAPVLKRADIGISMGAIGSNSAIEASDIVLMTDDVDKIIKGISISKYTNKIIMENLIFAISVKIAILLLSVIGHAYMWLAVFADTGVTVLTILNTLRILNKYKK